MTTPTGAAETLTVDAAPALEAATSGTPARRGPVDPRLLRYAHAARGFFLVSALIGVAQTLVIIAFAWLLTLAVVHVIEGAQTDEIARIAAALVGVVLLRGALLWAAEWASARASARVSAQLRAALVDAVQTLGPGWLARHNTASLAVTAGHGLDALDAYFGRYLPQLVLTAITTPVILAVMAWQDWLSGLTVLLTLPLIPIFMVLIGLATRSVQRTQWQTLHRLAARFSDTVEGLGTLKLYGRERRAVASIERVSGEYRRETMRVLRVSFLSGFALEFLASIAVALIAVSIGFRLLDGTLTLMVGLFVLLLAPEAYLPVRQVGVQFHAAAEGVAATDDIFAVLDAAAAARATSTGRAAERPVPQPPGAAGTAGTLTVSGVRTRVGDRLFPPAEHAAISFTAAPGTITLIEGPSGSGKSSFFAALRGTAPFEGSATFAGTDLRTLQPVQWLAWAGQRPGLIAGTVAANVGLGHPEPNEHDIARALALAGAAHIDPQLELGVQGAGLSGGQAQRVAVARAIYRVLRGDAKVLALDEPSSALDATTEAALWHTLRGLADAGATVLLVSHRRSAREVADQVVSLGAGGGAGERAVTGEGAST